MGDRNSAKGQICGSKGRANTRGGLGKCSTVNIGV
jgi:hypothetical protein